MPSPALSLSSGRGYPAERVAGNDLTRHPSLQFFFPLVQYFLNKKVRDWIKTSHYLLVTPKQKPKIFKGFNPLSIDNYWHNSCSKMIGYFQAARTGGINLNRAL
jgi:hypothetical protein